MTTEQTAAAQALDALYAKYGTDNMGSFGLKATRADQEEAFQLRAIVWNEQPEEAVIELPSGPLTAAAVLYLLDRIQVEGMGLSDAAAHLIGQAIAQIEADEAKPTEAQ